MTSTTDLLWQQMIQCSERRDPLVFIIVGINQNGASPTRDVEVLRARATARSRSLSSYLRELIHDDTPRPTMVEVLERIATRDGVEVDPADIQAFIQTAR